MVREPIHVRPALLPRLQNRDPYYLRRAGSERSAAHPPESLDNAGDWISVVREWISAMGKPFVIGLCTLGAALSVASYFAVRGAWRLYIVTVWRRRQRARRAAS